MIIYRLIGMGIVILIAYMTGAFDQPPNPFWISLASVVTVACMVMITAITIERLRK